jgi:ketosteroid isomerase-like protein
MRPASEIVRACFKAYEDKDRAAIEEILSDDFHFSSPLDNAIDRRMYFERCWPVSENIMKFSLSNLVEFEGQVFVTYEGLLTGGKSFRNTEIFEVIDGKIRSVEVYFGWDLPHPAQRGKSVNP